MFDLKKIGIIRRASAWLLDAILLAVLATGFMWIISLICGYSAAERLANEQYAAWEDFRKEDIPGVAEFYGFTYEEAEDGSYTVSKDGESASLQDVMDKLDKSEGQDEGTAEAYSRYKELPPAAKVNAQYRYVYSLLFMMVSLGIFFSYMILEFILPLILKNGQTVGKKVFGICLVRPNCVKIAPIALFGRTLIGKFAIETMFPILLLFLFFLGGLGILALILLAALFILNIVLFFATKNRTPIHDVLAYTVAVDMRLQMIYESEEELNAKKAAAKRVREKELMRSFTELATANTESPSKKRATR